MSLGCAAALDSDRPTTVPVDAAVIFAPVGGLIPLALKSLRKGGTLVLGGIRMSAIPSMPYELLWGERTVRSVANLTREEVPRVGCSGAHRHPRHAISTGSSQRGAGGSARRSSHRCGRPRAVTSAA